MALRRLDALTGIRALAALWVLAYHFAESPFGALTQAPILRVGYLGVDVFFLLSGFVIAHAYRAEAGSLVPRAVGRFYALRLARLYPVHLLVLLGLLAMVGVSRAFGIAAHHPETFRPLDFLFNLLLVQAWGVSAVLTWNQPAWSISCEWAAYLVFPFLALGLSRIVTPRQAIGWLVLVMAAFLVAQRALFDFDLNWALAGPALARVGLEFTAGAVCCRLMELTDLRSLPWTIVTLVAAGTAFVLWRTPMRDLAVVGAGLVVIAAGRYDENLVARLLGLPLLVYLGDISYSLYMVHVPIRTTLGRMAQRYIDAVGPSPAGFLIAAGFTLLTVASAAAVYHVVEAPARRWLRQRIDARLILTPGEDRSQPGLAHERHECPGSD